jgi:hypothetical protein
MTFRATILATVILATAVLLTTQPAAAIPAEPPQEQKRPPATAKAATRNPLDRLNKMTPEQRKKVIQKLPPERQVLLEKRLDQYGSLQPEERRRLNDQYRVFRQLPPERQEEMRKLFRRFNNQPEERKLLLQREFVRLRAMNETDRGVRLKNPGFRKNYSPAERRLLEEMANIAAVPKPAQAPQP